MPPVHSQSRVAGAFKAFAPVLVLAGGAVLTAACFLPWTSRGLGSTQSLLELSDLAGSDLIDDRWISPMLLVPSLAGTITIVLAGMVLASRDLRTDPRRIRPLAAVLLGLDLITVAVTALIVHRLQDGAMQAPGSGLLIGAAAMIAIGLGAGALLGRPGTLGPY